MEMEIQLNVWKLQEQKDFVMFRKVLECSKLNLRQLKKEFYRIQLKKWLSAAICDKNKFIFAAALQPL